MNREKWEDHKGYEIYLAQDESPQDPRDDDNVGEMIAYHRDYTLGDHGRKRDERWSAEDAHTRLVEVAREAGAKIEPDEYGAYNETDIDNAIKHLNTVGVILPLYLLDHSGIWMRTGRFAEDSWGWDTSMVGYIVATPEKIRENYTITRITKAMREKVADLLRGEVETYSKYISGDVLGYMVEKNGEDVASCWGYFDRDSALEDARAEADAHYARTIKSHIAKKKAEITHGVPLAKRSALNV